MGEQFDEPLDVFIDSWFCADLIGNPIVTEPPVWWRCHYALKDSIIHLLHRPSRITVDDHARQFGTTGGWLWPDGDGIEEGFGFWVENHPVLWLRAGRHNISFRDGYATSYQWMHDSHTPTRRGVARNLILSKKTRLLYVAAGHLQACARVSVPYVHQR
jgi:hypothetical protein